MVKKHTRKVTPIKKETKKEPVLTIVGDEFLCTKQLAKMLGVSVQWLEIGRCYGYGPKFCKLGAGLVRYRLSDVMKWVAVRTYESTSAIKGGKK